METNLIKHNPLLKKPVMCVLALAEETADRVQLESRALEAWDPRWSQTPSAIIDTLARNEMLQIVTTVNGKPYEGTLEDMQLDESVPDDAVAEERVAVTEAGKQLVQAYAPERTLAALFEEKPQYAEIFDAILTSCAAESGSTRPAIEALVESFPVAAEGAAAGQAKVYPQYFIDALETAGGIRWDGCWQTTAAGAARIAA